jgi:hypothetical protein
MLAKTTAEAVWQRLKMSERRWVDERQALRASMGCIMYEANDPNGIDMTTSFRRAHHQWIA